MSNRWESDTATREAINQWNTNLQIDYLQNALHECVEKQKQKHITNANGEMKALTKKDIELIQEYKILSLINVVSFKCVDDDETYSNYGRIAILHDDDPYLGINKYSNIKLSSKIRNDDVLSNVPYDKLYFDFKVSLNSKQFDEKDLRDKNKWITKYSFENIFNTNKFNQRRKYENHSIEKWNKLNSAVVSDILKEYERQLTEDIQLILMEYYNSFSKDMELDDNVIWNNEYKRNWWKKRQAVHKSGGSEIGMLLSDKHKMELIAYCLNIEIHLWYNYVLFVQNEWLNSGKIRTFFDQCTVRRKTYISY
eukprot:3832_1